MTDAAQQKTSEKPVQMTWGETIIVISCPVMFAFTMGVLVVKC